jgi:hypothetical protein
MLAGVASAKGPFNAELSGGNLDQPITIDETFPPDALNSVDVPAPASLPDVTYTLRLTFLDEAGQPADEFLTATYIPVHEGNNPLLRHPDGRYTTVSGDLAARVEIALDEASAAQLTPEDGGTTVAWWAIPSVIGAGLFLLGGAAAGTRILRKREAAAA